MTEDQLVQLVATAMITIIVVVYSFSTLRKRHMNDRRWATWGGALIYGLLFGGVMGVVIVPFQMQFMNGDMASMSPEEVLSRRLPSLIFFLIMIRSDVTGRLPLVGSMIRAYRSAILRRNIEGAEKRLDKLATLDARAGAGA